MQVSLELLFHYRCDRCQKWWSVADIYPTEIELVGIPCPHCGDLNAIDKIDYSSVAGLSPAQLQNLSLLLDGIAIELQKKALKSQPETNPG